eukprot:4726882-Prymnesium_polylepis.1
MSGLCRVVPLLGCTPVRPLSPMGMRQLTRECVASATFRFLVQHELPRFPVACTIHHHQNTMQNVCRSRH